jgi:uncharacterized protein (DUF885 family)
MNLRIFVASVAVALSACSSPPPATPPAADTSQDQTLKDTLHKYVVEFLRRNPTTNTYLGGAGFDPSLVDVDGQLRDHSIAALETEDRWLAETQKAIEGIAADHLSPIARVDRTVALAQIAFILHQHQARHYQERALDTYVSEPFRALDWQLQGMTETGAGTYGTAAEWDLVVKRVRAIPAFLATAQAQIAAGVQSGRVPDRRMLERDGLNSAAANAKYFSDTLPGMARQRVSGDERTRLVAEVTGAGRAAADAYLDFRKYIADTFFESGAPVRVKAAFAADRFAFGEEEYNWALKNNLRLDKPAAQLYEEAWPIVERTRGEMVRSRGASARRITGRFRPTVPPPCERFSINCRRTIRSQTPKWCRGIATPRSASSSTRARPACSTCRRNTSSM